MSTTVGKLRQRLHLESSTPTRNSVGEEVDNWEAYDVVWGEVVPLSGRELFQARQVEAEVTHRVTIRYRDGVSPKHRVIHKNRTLEVVSVLDREERERWLDLVCKEAIA